MLSTGDYRILYYNKYGTHLKHIKQTADSYMVSLKLANEFLEKRAKKHARKGGDVKLVPVSYTVDRRIFNSLDKVANF